MTLQQRAVLTRELDELRENILRLSSMVDIAIDRAVIALTNRDVALAHQVVLDDSLVNALRFKIEEDALLILATQQPMAKDLRLVIAGIHFAVELERIGDHAAGIARLVQRLDGEDPIESLYKIPKMAKRVREMIAKSVQAYVQQSPDLARAVISQDDKIDKQYRKLYQGALEQMRDDSYVHRATFMLWIGHTLENAGDSDVQLAERVIFMVTGEFIENLDDVHELDDFIEPNEPS